jgi:hypothetical protein
MTSFGTLYSQEKSGLEERKDGRVFVKNMSRRDNYRIIQRTTEKNNAYI